MIFWANAGVGNFAASAITGLVIFICFRWLRLHERVRDWVHKPVHERLDAHEAKLNRVHEHLGITDDDV